MTLPAAFGNGLSSNAALKQAVFFDAYGRDYQFDLGARMSQPRDMRFSNSFFGFMDGDEWKSGNDKTIYSMMGNAYAGGETKFGDMGIAVHNFAGLGNNMKVMQLDAVRSFGFTTAVGDAMLSNNARTGGVSTNYKFDRNTSLQVGFYYGDKTMATGDSTDNQVNNNMNAIKTGLSRRFGNLTFGLSQSIYQEKGSMMGGNTGGAFSSSGVSTSLTGLETSYRMTDDSVAFGRIEAGTMSGFDSALVQLNSVTVSRFELGLVSKVSEQNTVGLMVSSPLHVDSGSANVVLPTGRLLDGTVVTQNLTLDAAPKARELDLEVGFKRQFLDGGLLQASLMFRNDAGNIEGKQDTGVMLGYKKRF
jgi:hypothetical protein